MLLLFLQCLKNIDPLLFLFIPRSPKACSQNIATFKSFPSQIPRSLLLSSLVVFILITRLAVILSSCICVVMVFQSQRSLVDISTLDWLPNFPTRHGLTRAKIHSLGKWMIVSGDRTVIVYVAINHYTMALIQVKA